MYIYMDKYILTLINIVEMKIIVTNYYKIDDFFLTQIAVSNTVQSIKSFPYRILLTLNSLLPQGVARSNIVFSISPKGPANDNDREYDV